LVSLGRDKTVFQNFCGKARDGGREVRAWCNPCCRRRRTRGIATQRQSYSRASQHALPSSPRRRGPSIPWLRGSITDVTEYWVARLNRAMTVCGDALLAINARNHGCKITLPIALRPASTLSASAVCASGKVRSTCEEILPSAVHFTSFSRLARFFSGLSRAQ
jgi:hypothetical protein